MYLYAAHVGVVKSRLTLNLLPRKPAIQAPRLPFSIDISGVSSYGRLAQFNSKNVLNIWMSVEILPMYLSLGEI